MKFDLSHIYVELKDETPIALVIRTLPILVAFLNSSSWILVDIVVKLDMVYKKYVYYIYHGLSCLENNLSFKQQQF